ncbi:SRPBCC family protein [Streptomyces phaeofaciens JCM 4814]|uniref:MxaD family protein n=1 Tax=Streptomyces phaeofaciens TaxID=68254 RepID=A0A918M056_9ACTN|nr:SRPBCC family protein [Streptomyces phaeofaciens]GGT88141.1 MxaD family protein [Streptomyces phaeofaciens]
MTAARVTLDVPWPADRVWQLIGGFGSLPDWLPYITESVPGEGGRLRTLTNAEGGVIVERLEAFDETARAYTYSITRAPFPVTGYRSTLQVVDRGVDGSRVEWSGTFTPDGVTDAEATALFEGIYRDGLAALAERLGA